MIEPENNVIKVKPEEVELFPHSDSKLWDAFKKSDIENNNNEIVSKNKNSNSDNTKKNI